MERNQRSCTYTWNKREEILRMKVKREGGRKSCEGRIRGGCCGKKGIEEEGTMEWGMGGT